MLLHITSVMQNFTRIWAVSDSKLGR